MPDCYFIAGTDTGCGKTTVACHLLAEWQSQGFSAVGLKPIASGCLVVDDQLQNDDAIKLQQAASIKLDYPEVNPIAFEPPIAPHIAAEHAGVNIDAQTIASHCNEVINKYNSDKVLIEGCGGWLVPISASQTMADIVQYLDCKIILVVGIKLGCISHSLLTYQAILHSKLPIAGWYAVLLDNNTDVVDENIAAIQQRIDAPLLSVIPAFL